MYVQKAGFNIEFSDPSNKTPRKFDGSEERVKMKIVEVDAASISAKCAPPR